MKKPQPRVKLMTYLKSERKETKGKEIGFRAAMVEVGELDYANLFELT